MKKLIFILLIIVVSNYANAKKVKFAVDMRSETINSTGIHVMGDFQAAAGFPNGNWQPNTTSLTRETIDTNIYSVIVDIPAGKKYEYRFLNGDQSYDAEFVPTESRVNYNFIDNRWIYIDSLANDTSLVGMFLFASNAPAGKNLVRFYVNMKNVSSLDASGIHVAGSFNNWNYTNTKMFSFQNNIYEYIAYVDSGSNVEFKFINGNTLNKSETIPSACASNGNRYAKINNDWVMDTICFSSCSACEASGISEKSISNDINIYPNPARNYTTVSFNNNSNSVNISLMNLNGNTIRKYENIKSNSFKIDTENLAKGIYFLTILANDLSSVHKLIIE